ncbi:DUF6266 family protein [Pedobacter hartonius]|uniref:Uncharacterized protein n=1 Tax=Pedobacter hartonius TaxID=425514 RepID=A0A1H3ZWZ3_9SPHI|nr:DUF6266 family protein [Pedobacter hartonius]SEA28226.1 hypothetical protein SAMN05443550_102523 [Pedobacter hartonius]
MAKLTNGFNGPLKGKLGKAVAYILNDENIIRSIGERNKKKDSEMTDTRLRTKLATDLITPVNDFIKFSFAYEAKKHKTWNFHNAASSIVREAISGTFPNLYVDYSKVLFASGKLPLPKNLAAEVVEKGLKFTWDTSSPEKGAKRTDLAMVLAYYPETANANFIRSGSRRSSGYEILPLTVKNQIAEIYIAFISDDHSKVSDSVYLGQIKWQGSSAPH